MEHSLLLSLNESAGRRLKACFTEALDFGNELPSQDDGPNASNNAISQQT